MMKKMLAVIDDTIHIRELQDLTLNRSIAAIPFAGRYRLIDFTLSTIVNSGITSVAIFPKYYYRSLMDHLGSGKEWDLNRKRDGLFFLPLTSMYEPANSVATFKQYREHLDYFYRSKEKYAVIVNSHTICNLDFNEVLLAHLTLECDITEIVHEGRSLNMYILERELLIELIENEGINGFRSIQDIVQNKEQSSLKVCPFHYTGYAAVVDSIENYFNYSLEILQPDYWKQIFAKDRPVYTKVKDEPPARYTPAAQVKNSLIANGSYIEGTVENSIISRAVKIGENSVVQNSIIMQKSQIGQNCHLEYVILDKDVKIGDNVRLQGTPHSPIVLRKGTVQGAVMSS